MDDDELTSLPSPPFPPPSFSSGPCKTISPHFVKLSNSILHATFVKVSSTFFL